MGHPKINGHTRNLRAARTAGLVYVSDDSPGIHRRHSGRGFVYFNSRGKKITSDSVIQRINHLAIPPAYKDVWICPNPRGHIQAVGRDDRGRKQYRYHEKWRAVRDETKYDKLIDFARNLPKIRRTVAADLRMHDLPREKVLAAVIKFMEQTLIRVGNDEYAKANHSFGLTTLRNRHVKVTGSKTHFEFRGKSGIEHTFDVSDARLADIARKCQHLPGQELFGYRDSAGKVHDIGSADVNDYLRSITGEEFTAKDFRTWAGTVCAAAALSQLEKFKSESQAKKNIVRAVETVAEKLGNTKAVCRKCYIHPEIVAAYMEGVSIPPSAAKTANSPAPRNRLRAEEKAVVALLKRRRPRQGARTV